MLWYAKGPLVVREAVPGSAFSKGDILMYTSASSLSRVFTSSASVGALAAGLVIGVAQCSSLESYNNKCSYIVADRDTIFWSDATIGSQFTAGESLDVEYTGATFRLTTSAISPMLRVMPEGDSVDLNAINSQRSVCLVKFDESQLQFRA
jgi:hypothetical protein